LQSFCVLTVTHKEPNLRGLCNHDPELYKLLPMPRGKPDPIVCFHYLNQEATKLPGPTQSTERNNTSPLPNHFFANQNMPFAYRPYDFNFLNSSSCQIHPYNYDNHTFSEACNYPPIYSQQQNAYFWHCQGAHCFRSPEKNLLDGRCINKDKSCRRNTTSDYDDDVSLNFLSDLTPFPVHETSNTGNDWTNKNSSIVSTNSFNEKDQS